MKIVIDNKFTMLIDKRDYDKYLKGKHIGVNKIRDSYYACICVGSGKRIHVHRLIMEAKKGEFVDHKFHNTLDNRRKNLRKCTNKQNIMNSRKFKKECLSKYKGVSFTKRHKFRPWIAYISFDKKRIHIGSFALEIDAAKAYNEKAKELFGEFAYLNDV